MYVGVWQNAKQLLVSLITFCVSRRRRKMYCDHARLCVYCTDLDVIWVRGRGCHLVVHCQADLQLGHGLCCYGNITRTLVTSLRPSRDMSTYCERPSGRGMRALLAGDWRVTGGVLKIVHRIWEVAVAVLP